MHELDKVQVLLLGEKVLSAMKRIQEVVHTCDMNLWMSCLLNNQGFLIKHPVLKMKLGQQDQRQRYVRDQNEMAKLNILERHPLRVCYCGVITRTT